MRGTPKQPLMKHILYILFWSSLLGISLLFSDCKKHKLNTDSSARLNFSQDSVLFDTIFTTIGSTTHRFKVYNPYNQSLNIAKIWLDQGMQSMFRINVDGASGVEFEDIEILPKDSLFVFVEVTIDPNNSTNPMVVEDKIHFLTNGNLQQVVLTAWGQDAYFHNREIIGSNTTWNNDKPHVIYDYCAVDSNITLTIPAGTNIYSHSNAMLLVYKGSLQCNGTPSNLVTFQQDRLEDFILSSPDSVQGQWRGIRFFGAQNSLVSHTYIKNALIGIQIDTLQANQKVTLYAVQIHNCSYANLLSQGGNINAVNCLFGNNATYSAFISIGGEANFDFCTFGNYWTNSTRNTPLLAIKNYYKDNAENIYYRPFNQVTLNNSIIYGSNDNEFVLDTLSRDLNGVNAPNITISNCLIKTEDPVEGFPYVGNNYANNDPNFISPELWDFHISSTSFAKGKAGNSTVVTDLEGNARANPASLGCYE